MPASLGRLKPVRIPAPAYDLRERLLQRPRGMERRSIASCFFQKDDKHPPLHRDLNKNE
jgi:hypothetical protein